MFMVDLYNGSYGVTLRIASKEEADFMELQQAAMTLAHARDELITLSVVGCKNRAHRQDLICVAKQGGLRVTRTKGGAMELTQNRDGWRLCAGLVEGLLKPGGGHQYIGLDCGYGVIVELSYKE